MKVEVGKIMVGAVVCMIGVLALGISLWTSRRKDPLLASWGAFALTWGISLLVGTPAVQASLGSPSVTWRFASAFLGYLLPVTFAGYLVGLFGKGRGNFYSWMLGVAALFAAGAILSDIVQSTPGTAMPLGRGLGVVWGLAIIAGMVWSGVKLTVELRVFLVGVSIFALAALSGFISPDRILPSDLTGTGPGLLVLVSALGYVSVRRYFVDSKRLVATDQEMETARQIQLSLIPHEIPPIENLSIAERYVPATVMGGNFYDSVPVGDGLVCVLAGDAGGRGIAGAALASMLKVSFASHVAASPDPAHVLTGMNRFLGERTENKSAAVSCLLIDQARRAMAYANAGHPPLLIWRRRGREFEEIGGSAVALGPVADAKYSNTHLPFDPGDRAIMYSKGVTEALDPGGRLFGEKRFRTLLRSNEHLTAEACAEAVTQNLLAWAGTNGRGELKDDLTVVVVDMLDRSPD